MPALISCSIYFKSSIAERPSSTPVGERAPLMTMMPGVNTFDCLESFAQERHVVVRAQTMHRCPFTVQVLLIPDFDSVYHSGVGA